MGICVCVAGPRALCVCVCVAGPRAICVCVCCRPQSNFCVAGPREICVCVCVAGPRATPTGHPASSPSPRHWACSTCQRRYGHALCVRCRVGQDHAFIGIYGVHTVFIAGKSPYIRSYVIYGAGIRFWLTLVMCHVSTGVKIRFLL